MNQRFCWTFCFCSVISDCEPIDGVLNSEIIVSDPSQGKPLYSLLYNNIVRSTNMRKKDHFFICISRILEKYHTRSYLLRYVIELTRHTGSDIDLSWCPLFTGAENIFAKKGLKNGHQRVHTHIYKEDNLILNGQKMEKITSAEIWMNSILYRHKR